MRYLLIVLGLFVSFFGNAQSQGVTNAQTKLRPNQLRWSPTDATLDSVYIIRADTATGEPGWYLVTLGGSGGGVADTTLSGDVIGGLNSTFVRKINGVTVENKTPQNREVLTYNGTQWTPDSIDLADLPTLAQSVLLGRGSASTGVPQAISLGTGLSMSGTTLSNSAPDQTVTISGATGTYPNFTVTPTSPAGSSMQVQYNNAGSFGALDSFTVSANPDMVGIGVPTPTARLDIQGSGSTSATNALRVRNSAGTNLLAVRNDGKVSFTNGSVTSSSTNDAILGITGFTHTANSGTSNSLWGLNIDGTQSFNTANQTSGGLRIKLSNNATTSQYNIPLYIESNAATDAINYIKNTSSTGGSSIRLISGSAETSMTLIQSPNCNAASVSEGNGITVRTSSTHLAMGLRSSALALMNSSTSGNPLSVNPTLFILDKRIGVGQYAVNTPNATLDIKGEGATSSTNALYIRNSSNTKLFTIRDDGLLNYSVTKTPSSASDTGTTGDIAWDSNYIYVCVATNTWKRVAIATW